MVDVDVNLQEEAKDDSVDIFGVVVGVEPLANGAQGDVGCVLVRVAVHPGGHARKGDGAELMWGQQIKWVLVASLEQTGLLTNRPDRVNDVWERKESKIRK